MNPYFTETQYRDLLVKPYYWETILIDIPAACRTELNAEPDRSNWRVILSTYGVDNTYYAQLEYETYLWRQSPKFRAQMKEAEELYGV